MEHNDLGYQEDRNASKIGILGSLLWVLRKQGSSTAWHYKEDKTI